MTTLKCSPLPHFRLTQLKLKYWLIGSFLTILSLGIYAEDELGFLYDIPEEETIRVIVGLKIPVQSEEELRKKHGQAMAKQRKAIRLAKTKFIKELRQSLRADGLDYAPSMLKAKKQFKNIPYFVMEVNYAIALKIQENSQVAYLDMEVPYSSNLFESTAPMSVDEIWDQGVEYEDYGIETPTIHPTTDIIDVASDDQAINSQEEPLLFEAADCQILLDEDIDIAPDDDVEDIALLIAACEQKFSFSYPF